uniref:Uncharacterized protein n=1 Tax=Arundo donax TaxID=35708 RepID=A0A0A9CP64_ARUDO
MSARKKSPLSIHITSTPPKRIQDLVDTFNKQPLLKA